ncbi:hypothetical protein LshimejAT787_0104280 [Lyophyllum shimeji]|uniref:CcmS related domain-containing protein n=1 Tax=Lyophyllum shimeji TaxID=47721 RepID=A0A9P3PDC1_LYOSH|nr:hypothetical protein LshimejAT787_0104280 [Lyophyllum shimeji]
MPPKKGTKGKGKQAEEKVDKKGKKEPTPPPAPSPAREPTPTPPTPELEPEPFPVPAPVSIAATEHEARQHGHRNDDVNASGHDLSEGQGNDDGWGNSGRGWDNVGPGGNSDGGGGWVGGDDGWGETGGAGGSEFDEGEDSKNAGAWGDTEKSPAPAQDLPSPSQPAVPIQASAPAPAPPPPQPAAPLQPFQPHDWSAAQVAPLQAQDPPPLTQKEYTSASSMANRGAQKTSSPTEQRAQDQRAADRPSYYWAPNQASSAKQPVSFATAAPRKPQMPPLSAWGEPKHVDPWGSPKPQPQAPAPPAKPPMRQAWQDWGKQPQPPPSRAPASRAPSSRNYPTPSAWTVTHDDEEYSEDEESDETHADPWGRPARGQPGWGADPRKQPKVTFAPSGSDYGSGTGTKPVLSPQEHSQILRSLLNELPQSQHGYQQRGHHPQQSAQPNPQHRRSQWPPQDKQAMAHHKHASQDGGKKPEKLRKPKGGGWEDGGWGAGGGDGDGWDAGGDGRGAGGNGWGTAEDGWGGGGDTWGGGGKKEGKGGSEYGGWQEGGGGGWDNATRGKNQGWDQNDGWENHDNSWSNTKGSTNDWGGGKDQWGPGDNEWGNDDGWGEHDDALDEEENEWEGTHHYHHVGTSKGNAWGGSETESQYFMPSKTLSHAIKGTQLKAANGEPPNKMDEYTNVKFLESRKAAFAPVQRAIFGRERKARDRIHWMFSPNKDDRVWSVLGWIQAMEYNLGSFGLHKFLQSRERGALFVNVTFRLAEHPNQPVFDWLTFDEIQPSTDRILQESILSYDPSMQVVIFVYLPSPTGNSVAMWRRKVLVPNNTRLRFQREIVIAIGGLKRDKDYIVHVDEMPPKNKTKAAQPGGKQASPKSKQDAKQAAKQGKSAHAKSALVKHHRGQSLPAIIDLTDKPQKKRKWWQILRFAD